MNKLDDDWAWKARKKRLLVKQIVSWSRTDKRNLAMRKIEG